MLPTTGPMSLDMIAAEFPLLSPTTPHALSNFYGGDVGVPESGKISNGDFYGATSLAPIETTPWFFCVWGEYQTYTDHPSNTTAADIHPNNPEAAFIDGPSAFSTWCPLLTYTSSSVQGCIPDFNVQEVISAKFKCLVYQSSNSETGTRYTHPTVYLNNGTPQPPFGTLMSQLVAETPEPNNFFLNQWLPKETTVVEEFLGDSQAVQDYWNRGVFPRQTNNWTDIYKYSGHMVATCGDAGRAGGGSQIKAIQMQLTYRPKR